MSTFVELASASATNPWSPQMVTVREIKPEALGVATYKLTFDDPAAAESYRFEPGQFNMLYLPGFGESAISVSSDPEETGSIGHTVRAAGSVTRALSKRKVGQKLGLRGPFGTHWPVEECHDKDVVIACGGVGLAPLRPVIYHIIRHRSSFGRVILLYGARTPADLLFADEYDAWKKARIEVACTVDIGSEYWRGSIGCRAGIVLSLAFGDAPDARADLRPGNHDAFRHLRGPGPADSAGAYLRFHGTQHELRAGVLRALPAGAQVRL